MTTRLEVNDFAMEAIIRGLRITGNSELAEKTKEIYEVQRAEIMANEELCEK